MGSELALNLVVSTDTGSPVLAACLEFFLFFAASVVMNQGKRARLCSPKNERGVCRENERTAARDICRSLKEIWGLQTLFLSSVHKILEHLVKIKPVSCSCGDGKPTFPPGTLLLA